MNTFLTKQSAYGQEQLFLVHFSYLHIYLSLGRFPKNGNYVVVEVTMNMAKYTSSWQSAAGAAEECQYSKQL